MSRNAKIGFVVAGSLALMCVCGCIGTFLIGSNLMQNAVTTETEKSRQIARQIFEYDLPPGYSEQFGLDIVFYKMAVFSQPGTQRMLFMALQASGMNRAQMEQQMRQALEQQFERRSLEMTLVGTEQVIVKGKSATLGIYEGTAEEGIEMRQAMVAFEGKSGSVLLMAMASQAHWDRPALDYLLASIR